MISQLILHRKLLLWARRCGDTHPSEWKCSWTQRAAGTETGTRSGVVAAGHQQRIDTNHCAASVYLLFKYPLLSPALALRLWNRKWIARHTQRPPHNSSNKQICGGLMHWDCGQILTQVLSGASQLSLKSSKKLTRAWADPPEKQSWLSRDTWYNSHLREDSVRGFIFISQSCWSKTSQTGWPNNRNRLSHKMSKGEMLWGLVFSEAFPRLLGSGYLAVSSFFTLALHQRVVFCV